jgi:chaperonin GroEL
MARRHPPARSAQHEHSQKPRLVFHADAYAGMQKGINTIAEAIRPTLGPLPRLVAIDPVARGNKPPKLMDDGGLIARRILELGNADADMGAMLLRQLLWKQRQEAGDGTATTAVLFQSVYNQGVKYVAAGGNPMRLRHYLEAGLCIILDQLAKLTTPLDGQEQITGLALSVGHDIPLAEALGEIFDVIGEHGLLEIRSGHSRETTWEFVEGAYFKGGLHVPAILGQSSVELADAAVFVSDLELDEPEQLVRLVALAYAMQKKSLVIVVRELSKKVVGLLASINKDTAQFQAIAVKAPTDVHELARLLDDMGVLTGGRVFLRALGDMVDAAQINHLGGARRVWADGEYCGLIGGKGSPIKIRDHITHLRKALYGTDDLDTRKRLRERIGNLIGGAAILRVGGSTDLEINVRKDNAERTSNALRGALVHGVLPGGVAALLNCQGVLKKKAERAENLDERMAYCILSRALEEPLRAILGNAGYEAEPVLAHITKSGGGFDVRCGKFVDTTCVEIMDSAGVMRSAVHGAVASAGLALTIEVLVHHRRPAVCVNP